MIDFHTHPVMIKELLEKDPTLEKNVHQVFGFHFPAQPLEIFRREKLDPALLPPWRDIDTYEDLRRLRERHREGFFANSRTMRYLLSRDGA